LDLISNAGLLQFEDGEGHGLASWFYGDALNWGLILNLNSKLKKCQGGGGGSDS
jgi:hypothetical protein